MSDPLFTFSGVSSGVQWDEMIDEIMTKARKVETVWKNKQDTLDLKIDLYKELVTNLKAVQTAITSLKTASTYQTKQAEFTTLSPAGANSASIATATVDKTAAIDSWKLEVLQTATAERRVSDRWDTASESLGLSGTFRIYVGSQWGDITVDSDDSLRDINLKIQQATDANGDTLGVTSQLIDNRLVIESANSGLGQDTISGETFTMGSSDTIYLSRNSTNTYPDTIVSLKSGSTTFANGTDFSYDSSTGKITWLTSSKPSSGTEFTATYQDVGTVTRGTTNTETMGTLPSGGYPASVSIKSGSTTYTQGTDYSYDPSTGVVTWLSGGSSPAAGTTYSVVRGSSYTANRNVFFLEDVSGTLVSGTKAAGTGLGLSQEVDSEGVDHHTDAQDAKLKLNDLSVTRSSNEISDLIAGVTLKLVGAGKVQMDVTLDAEDVVTATQSFVTAYNDTMDWINTRLSEETQEVPEDATLSEDFYKKFGLLHGDPLLWQIKDQLRSLVSSPVTTLPASFTTNAQSSSTKALGLSGSFYVDLGGKRARIDVEATDTLTSIQTKLQNAKDLTGSTVGSTATGSSMNYTVSIDSGRLVIKPTGTSTTTTSQTYTISRTGDNADLLPITPNFESPISGSLTITSGNKTYKQNVDFTVKSTTDPATGKILNKIVWTGTPPTTSYTAKYTYYANSVDVTPISGNVSQLGFHEDNSTKEISFVGISTVSTDYGKSGKLQFDTDKFMKALKSDSNTVANLMSGWFSKLSTTITNLTSESTIQVGSTTGVQGRVASQIASLKEQSDEIDDRIEAYEKRLSKQQSSLYKQYASMEKTLNSYNTQLSWLKSIVDQLSSS